MDPALIAEAVKTAIAAEATTPKDGWQFQANSFSKEPFNSIIGPVKTRGGAAGLIVHKGAIVADTQRDEDFSDDGCRSGVAARNDQGRQRLRPGLYAAEHRPVRV